MYEWVYKAKTKPDGSVEFYVQVAGGYDLNFGSDYDEISSSSIKRESLKSLIALSTHGRLELSLVDVTIDFLNGTSQEEIYIYEAVNVI